MALWLVILLVFSTTLLLFYAGLCIPGMGIRFIYEYWFWACGAVVLVALAVAWYCRRLRWLLSRSALTVYLWASAIVVSLVLLFYSVESWRGKWMWKELKVELESRGETLELMALAPKPVPAEQDFAAVPLIAEYFDPKVDRRMPARFKKLDLFFFDHPDSVSAMDAVQQASVMRNELTTWPRHQTIRLEKWQSYLRIHPDFSLTNALPSPPAAVLLALSRFQGELQELDQASHRPYARFPLPYEKGLFGYDAFSKLGEFDAVGEVLQLRAVARLAVHDTAAAFQDVQLLLRLIRLLQQEPFSFSDRNRLMLLAQQPIYEGLARRSWSDLQLASLQILLQQIDFVPRYQEIIRANVLQIIDFMDQLIPIRSGRTQANPISENDQAGRWLLTGTRLFYPSGWSLQNQVGAYRAYQERMLTIADVKHRRISPSAAREVSREISRHPPSLDPICAVFVLPRISDIPHAVAQLLAYSQASMDQATLGCALERYRIAHGQFPETLDALVPRFMAQVPRDVVNGQPMHYRRLPNGQFILYSIGWNQTDDGGQVHARVDYHSWHVLGPLQIQHGDWVWQYPAQK